jgi:CxxC motif-containing protein (DUF1111 family)
MTTRRVSTITSDGWSMGSWAMAVGVMSTVAACAPSTERDVLAMRSSALLGDPLPGTDTVAFDANADTFAEVETVDDGVGPVFNERACGNCHNVGALGGSGVQFEVRAGSFDGAAFHNLEGEGGQLFDLFSVTSLPPTALTASCPLPPNGEPVPGDANVVALRRTTALFGLGLVEATPDATFTALAAAQPVGIRGHAAQVPNLRDNTTSVGKFGWKSQVPTLFQFSGDAYLNEMGITNPMFPNEQVPQGNPAFIPPCDGNPVEPDSTEDDGGDVQAFTDFMTFLAPPPAPVITGQAHSGQTIFSDIGCAGCHVPTLTSGNSDFPQLANQTYHPYSDFLVHDMGSLGDGIPGNGNVGRTEMRTAPLWGLHFVDPTNLLHDGRATSVADAIQRHDGQGAAARDAFNALPPGHKNNLLAFLATL